MGKLNYKTLSLLYIISLCIVIVGCIDNNTQPIFSISLNNTAKIISYVESQGDYPNNSDAPYLITAYMLYNQLSQYVILDVRSRDEFISGHIQGSVNISNQDIYSKVDSIFNSDINTKIVLVCKNGQESAYYASLLHIAGFNYIWSLEYGLASWNQFFADEWLSILGNAADIIDYTNQNYEKLNLSEFPTINIPATLKSNKDITVFRVKEILNQGFKLNLTYYPDMLTENHPPSYNICYGIRPLYFEPPLQYGHGHPINTVWFTSEPDYDFRSSMFLQSLPDDQTILIYSTNGHLSSSITAYLRVLGFDAKTLMYGANQLFFSRCMSDSLLYKETFGITRIMNYPFVTGR